MSRQIVELMGGELRFGNLGQGSRFWFELLLKRAGPVRTAGRGRAMAIATGRRILVVDDSVTNLVLLKELLEIVATRLRRAPAAWPRSSC